MTEQHPIAEVFGGVDTHALTHHAAVVDSVGREVADTERSPGNLVPRLPRPEETPNRLTCGGLGHAGVDDLYWFVETITSRELLDSWRSNG
jgi:hypothetical protein